MTKYLAAIVLLYAAFAAPVLALEAGECGPAKVIQTRLTSEGQRLLASATGVLDAGPVPIRITSQANGEKGYYLREQSPNRLCVVAVLSEVATIAALARQGPDICTSPKPSARAKAVCANLERQMRGLSPQQYITFTSPTSLHLGGGPVLTRVGFCHAPGGQRMVCSTTETRLTGK